MTILYDEACAEYEKEGHPEAAFRVQDTWSYLQRQHGERWHWQKPLSSVITESDLQRAHDKNYLEDLKQIRKDFDEDTPCYPDVFHYAVQAASAALEMMHIAKQGEPVFSLMRPPGHHATRDQAMGFCYLNSVVIAALKALEENAKERITIWDFDAHHGNGTEAIVLGHPQIRYVSVHQSLCYPGTGLVSQENCFNYPVEPYISAREHMEVLRQSWNKVVDFSPTLVLVSAGFDAYTQDPLTQLSLERENFAELGNWLHHAGLPSGALLEGGYSRDLPYLVDGFLVGWDLGD
ncbi:MAG: histone deacetylase [Verrucomicrobiae bacterium]|nr:histone deacetylase [Verrucomicrobiae bacterium]